MRTSLQILSTLLAAHIAITAQAQVLDTTLPPSTATETTTAPTMAPSTATAPSTASSTATATPATTPAEASPATATVEPIAPKTPATPTTAVTSNKSITHWLCGEKATPLLLTNDDTKGLIEIGNSTVEMNHVPTEQGVSYSAADGSGASFTIMNNAAVLVAVNKDKTSCALVEQPAVTQ